MITALGKLRPDSVGLLTGRISAITRNKANLISRANATMNYLALADRAATRLRQAGRKGAASGIESAIISFHNREA